MKELSAIAVDVTPPDRFREYLGTQAKRLTRERSIIVDEVFASHEHFDAEQLVARLSQRTDGNRVSRSTVYRTLAELEKAGLLRKVARSNDREIYEHDYGYPQHDHLICKKCGELTEFQNPELNEILQQVAAQYGFRMEGHRLEVSGICAACSRPPSRGHRKLDMI
ncbi:MAG: fur [Planctomycetaceae bacterium]|nr:fur [Planctomycetaceae bacterium]